MFEEQIYEVTDFKFLTFISYIIVFSSKLSLIVRTFCVFCRVSGQSFNRLYLMKALHED